MSVLAENLRCLRLKSGLTQEKLGAVLGVSAQAVSRWECGSTLPDVLLLPQLARTFGVTTDDLFRERANAYPNYAQRLLAVYEASGRGEDLVAAEQEFERLLAGEHTADDLRAYGVLCHYAAKRYVARAERRLDDAIAVAEPNSLVRRSAAQQRIALLCDLGRGGEAVSECEKELAEKPSDEETKLLCVAAHFHAKSYEKAYELAENAAETSKNNAIFHVYAGDAAKALGRYDEAFWHWARVRELAPAMLDPYYSAALCREELGELDAARAAWRELRDELTRRGLAQEAEAIAERLRRLG